MYRNNALSSLRDAVREAELAKEEVENQISELESARDELEDFLSDLSSAVEALELVDGRPVSVDLDSINVNVSLYF